MNSHNVPTSIENRQVSPSKQQTTASESVSKTKPDRRAYFREYYRKNRERAREYQRLYSLRYRRKSRPTTGSGTPLGTREAVRSVYTITDIMQSPTEKTVRMLEGILAGERHFTM